MDTGGVRRILESTGTRERVSPTTYGKTFSIRLHISVKGYLHEVGHDLHYLLHGGTLRGVFGPASRHQALQGLRKVLDQGRPRTWEGAKIRA